MLGNRTAAADYRLISEQDILADIPVVLSVTRLSQPASHAPATLTVIDRQMIDASGARTIPDLFRLVPGFYVGYKSGNKPVVTYHGLSDTFSRRLQVLVDGRSVYIASTGGVQWSDLPLAIEDIKKIEVIRGPNTASYGANSFLAIISIHTYHASELPRNYAAALMGSHNERKLVYRHAGRHKDTSYRITLSSARDDEFDNKHDFSKTNQVTVRADQRLSTNDTLLFKFGALSGSRGEGGTQNLHDSTAHSHYEQIRWERKLGVDHDISLQLFHNLHIHTERYDLIGPGITVPINYDVNSERFDLEFQHRFRPTASSRLVWGLNTRLDRAKSPTFLPGTTQVFRSVRAFGNFECYLTPKLSINLGAMEEHNTFTGTALSPRLGLNFSVAPDHTLRAIVSRATRTPAIAEEKANARICLDAPTCSIPIYQVSGNPDLKAETITSHELGYYGVLANSLFIDVKVYRDEISDLITLVRDVPFANTDNVIVSGVETQLDFRPSDQNRMFVGYAYTHVDGEDVANNYTTSAPLHSLSLLVVHRFSGNLEGSAAYYYLDQVHPLDGSALANIKRLDLRLSQQFKSRGLHGRISLVGQSVLDDYFEYQTDNIFKSSAYVLLEIDL